MQVIFPSYLGVFNDVLSQEQNKALNELALQLELIESQSDTNVQFHSKYSLMGSSPYPALQVLFNCVKQKVHKFIELQDSVIVDKIDDNCDDPQVSTTFLEEVKSWCLLQRKHAYASMHTHFGVTYSCVYYSKTLCESLSPQGALEIYDPTQCISFGRHKSESTFIQPKEGMLVILPGYVPHCTHPIFVEGLRVSWVVDFVLKEVFC